MEQYAFPKGMCIPYQKTEEELGMKKENKPVIPTPGMGVSSIQSHCHSMVKQTGLLGLFAACSCNQYQLLTSSLSTQSGHF